MNQNLSNNALAFIALCNEYCMAVENARESLLPSFAGNMLRLLPRIYISASDLVNIPEVMQYREEEPYVSQALEEDYYESVRRSLESLLGEHDTYLEVFEEDMKYSDTPIAATVSEQLADLFQVMYNFLETVREATTDVTYEALASVSNDFESYWSRTLCNVMRPLNQLYYSELKGDDEAFDSDY